MREEIKNLKQITAPIFEDLKIFENEFREAMQSEVRLVNTIGKYLLRHKGKNIRPILTILSARITGRPTLQSYQAAAMIELLHVATLIHDDVVDEAEKRRGFLVLNKIWKNKVAVLMGDFLFSKVLINLIKLKDRDALELLSHTAEKLSAGEILQIEKSLSKSMTEDVYYDMIYQKTASLISTSCEIGAITASKEKNDRKNLASFGENLGMAFQIKDDLFDLLGNEKSTGKDMGADVKRNMVTLPLIHSYSNTSKAGARKINRILRNKHKTEDDVQELKTIIHETGGFNYAKNKIDDFSSKALESIHIYPDSVYKDSLTDLVAFNAHRIY
ncbi:MAG: polyprenyl synthetase family protein [Candidatus Marinimicrobia bacterium]|nr:polyprenyl synthetase family protein [Candidatus Neomarinimicrobiota bacterium]